MTTNEPEAALINSRQAAAILGISVETVARWARTGRLPTETKGEGVRGPRFFRRDTVQQLREELDREHATGITEAQPPAG